MSTKSGPGSVIANPATSTASTSCLLSTAAKSKCMVPARTAPLRSNPSWSKTLLKAIAVAIRTKLYWSTKLPRFHLIDLRLTDYPLKTWSSIWKSAWLTNKTCLSQSGRKKKRKVSGYTQLNLAHSMTMNLSTRGSAPIVIQAVSAVSNRPPSF